MNNIATKLKTAICILLFAVTPVYAELTTNPAPQRNAAKSRYVAPRVIKVLVTADDRIFYGGKQMSLDQIDTELKRKRSDASEMAWYHRTGNKKQQPGDVEDQLFDILLDGGLLITNFADKNYTRYRRW